MKDLVRSHDDADLQLPLAHDFHRAVRGTPRIIRALLRKLHLLEMPEEWNQHAFDHHVHDANTKGRKNPTHLVMHRPMLMRLARQSRPGLDGGARLR